MMNAIWNDESVLCCISVVSVVNMTVVDMTGRGDVKDASMDRRAKQKNIHVNGMKHIYFSDEIFVLPSPTKSLKYCFQ
jgi:hypothetical protein